MIEIGDRPIISHILKPYIHYGINEFVICCAYKKYMIKKYFANYFLLMSNVTFDMRTNSMEMHQKNAEPSEVTPVDTGEQALTGGRLKRVRENISDISFCFTYGDGVADIPIDQLIKKHHAGSNLATITSVNL